MPRKKTAAAEKPAEETESKTVNRYGNGRNTKGQFTKGNPGGGRKKMPEDTKQTFLNAAPECAKQIVNMAIDPEVKPELRERCCEYVIDRVYGKATSPIIAEVNASVDQNMTLDEMLQEALAITGGAALDGQTEAGNPAPG